MIIFHFLPSMGFSRILNIKRCVVGSSGGAAVLVLVAIVVVVVNVVVPKVVLCTSDG